MTFSIFGWIGRAMAQKHQRSFYRSFRPEKKRVLFGEMQSYLFHFANTTPSTESFNVSEQFQMHLSAGASYSNDTGLDTLQFAVGGLIGLERDRGVDKGFDKPIGITMRFNIEYNGLVQITLLTLVISVCLYDRHGDDLYWDPFFARQILRESKWYAQLIKSDRVNANIGLNMHMSENNYFFSKPLRLASI